jgi:hypothetical protein
VVRAQGVEVARIGVDAAVARPPVAREVGVEAQEVRVVRVSVVGGEEAARPPSRRPDVRGVDRHEVLVLERLVGMA